MICLFSSKCPILYVYFEIFNVSYICVIYIPISVDVLHFIFVLNFLIAYIAFILTVEVNKLIIWRTY